ncbi:MAG: metal-dependent hydrolase [Acidobacteria bacterium]|nr:metal-dependent hydrolase [Acidobacteriota bacterium]
MPSPAAPDAAFAFTWLGHATFRMTTPGGRHLLFDPWLTSPTCPESARAIDRLDLMLLSHGHDDHIADAVQTARQTGAHVLAPYELSVWLQQKGLRHVTGMNPGGTIRISGLSIAMVPALHSSSIVEDGRLVYLGLAAGYVVTLENGLTFYFAGDTALFGDMRLIGEIYKPAIAFLPIGDLYTMGPEQAAKACELLGVKQVVPMHWGTFPGLTGTPAELRRLVEPRGVEVVELEPGETAR